MLCLGCASRHRRRVSSISNFSSQHQWPGIQKWGACFLNLKRNTFRKEPNWDLDGWDKKIICIFFNKIFFRRRQFCLDAGIAGWTCNVLTASLPCYHCACSCRCWVAQSCPTLCDPRDPSLSGSPVPGTFQARTLEWVAISFPKSLCLFRSKKISSSTQGRTFQIQELGLTIKRIVDFFYCAILKNRCMFWD